MNRLPLAVSIARMAAAPIVAVLILWGDEVFFRAGAPITPWLYAAALVIFILAVAADLLDAPGKLNGASAIDLALGRAARLALVACTLLALSKTNLPFDLTIASVLIIASETALAGLREGLGAAGRPAPAGQGFKLKAGAIWLGAGCALAAQTLIYFATIADVIVWLLRISRGAIWAGAALSLITGAMYAREAFAKPKPSAQEA